MKKILLVCLVAIAMFLPSCTNKQGNLMTLDEMVLMGGSKEPPVNMAVLVGINSYPSCPLNGCVNDVYNMKKFLIDNKYFKEEEIHVITDDNATKECVMLHLSRMINVATSGSKMYFHNSTHGTQVPSVDTAELDGFNESICCVDFAWRNDGSADGAITDKEFVKIFSKFPKGVIFNWSSDSCHSGDLTREITPPTFVGKIKTKIKSFPIPAKVAAKLRLARAENPKSKSKDMVDGILDVGFLSGCRDDQTSADASFGGVSEGAFTHFLIQALKREPNANMKQLATMMQTDLRRSGFEQRPQAEGARIKKRFLSEDEPASKWLFWKK